MCALAASTAHDELDTIRFLYGGNGGPELPAVGEVGVPAKDDIKATILYLFAGSGVKTRGFGLAQQADDTEAVEIIGYLYGGDQPQPSIFSESVDSTDLNLNFEFEARADAARSYAYAILGKRPQRDSIMVEDSVEDTIHFIYGGEVNAGALGEQAHANPMQAAGDVASLAKYLLGGEAPSASEDKSTTTAKFLLGGDASKGMSAECLASELQQLQVDANITDDDGPIWGEEVIRYCMASAPAESEISAGRRGPGATAAASAAPWAAAIPGHV